MSNLKISRENSPSRIYEKDLSHIRRKIKDFGFSDTRFKDKSAAIRHYVHLGIITEKRTETANTLDDRIIKASQKEVVRDELLPLKKSIDGLIRVMENFEKKQDEQIKEYYKMNERIFQSSEGFYELVKTRTQKLLDELTASNMISEESLKNTIILRSLFYIFLLGYKTGRIEPSARTPWQQFVHFTHQIAERFSVTELEHLSNEKFSSEIVGKLANEMFAELKKMQLKISTE